MSYKRKNSHLKEFNRHRVQKKLLLWGSSILFLILLSITVSGWYFIHYQLVPLAEKNLTIVLERPVKLGQVKHFDLSSLHLSKTEISSTLTDPNRAEITSIELEYSLITLLTRRILNLDIYLKQPIIYVEQEPSQQWLKGQINTQLDRELGAISINIDNIYLHQGKFTFLPRDETSKRQEIIAINIEEGKVTFSKSEQHQQSLKFMARGGIEAVGDFKLEGDANLDTQVYNLNVSTEELYLSSLAKLVPFFITIQQRRMIADLEIIESVKLILTTSALKLLTVSTSNTISCKLNLNLTSSESPNSFPRLIEAEFEILGEQWMLGADNIDKLLVKGNFQEGVLTLLPLQLQLDDSYLLFTGALGGETSSGQFRLIELPISQIRKFIKLPEAINFNGIVNASSSIFGTIDNPQMRGELLIEDGNVYQTAFKSFKGSFNYQNSRLEFSSITSAEGIEAGVIIRGTIPFQLASVVEPEKDRIQLLISLKDRGMNLLINTLTHSQVNWVDGQADFQIDLSGTVDPQTNLPAQLKAVGKASISNGVISALVFPDDQLTDLNSNISFNSNELEVKKLIGNLGGRKLQAFGKLPLSEKLSLDQPFTLTLDGLAVKVNSLSQGRVTGESFFGDSALDLLYELNSWLAEESD